MLSRFRLLPIFLIVFIDTFGMTLIIPLLPRYAEIFHATAVDATLLFTVYSAGQMIAGPVLGTTSDRVGRKPMLVISQLGTLVSFVMLARASALWMLYVARMVDGATAGNVALAQAYISDNTTPVDRAKSFSLMSTAFGLGFTCGPLVAGRLLAYGITTPIYAALVVSALSILCTIFLLPRTARTPRLDFATGAGKGAGAGAGAEKRTPLLPSWSIGRAYFARPILGGLLAQFFFYAFAIATGNAGFALFAERRFHVGERPMGPREVAYVFAYVGALTICVQMGLLARLVKRYGESTIVFAGFVALLIGRGMLTMTTDIVSLTIAITVDSIAAAMLRPALISLISQRARREEQGAVLGFNSSLFALAGILAPPLGGVLIDHSALTAWASIAPLAALCGLIAARWGSSVEQPRTSGA